MQTGAGAANGWAVEIEHLDPQGFLDEKGDVAEQVVRAERGSQLSPADPTTTALQPSSCGAAVAHSLTRVPRWPRPSSMQTPVRRCVPLGAPLRRLCALRTYSHSRYVRNGHTAAEWPPRRMQ